MMTSSRTIMAEWQEQSGRKLVICALTPRQWEIVSVALATMRRELEEAAVGAARPDRSGLAKAIRDTIAVEEALRLP